MDKKELLKVIGISEVVEETKKEIESNQVERKILKTRFSSLNKQLHGGIPLTNKYINISGSSGSGKSYINNILAQDFQDPDLNEYKIAHLIINLEMNYTDEAIRMVEKSSGINYSRIMSYQSSITEEEKKKVFANLDKLKGKNIYFVKNSGNLKVILNTCLAFIKKFPDSYKFISVDHYLLPERMGSESELEMVINLSKMMLNLRKVPKTSCILISQLNDNIENPYRIDDASQHFPKKGDIYGSKAVYRDADYVLVIHRPERLGISIYGSSGEECKDKVYFHFLKGRLIDDGTYCSVHKDEIFV